MTELENMKLALDNLNAEKIALDQLFVESLKSNVVNKKDLVLLQQKVSQLENDKDNLKREKESLEAELNLLKNKDCEVAA